MTCSCIKTQDGAMLVRDPWCCYHRDIEWPKTPMAMRFTDLYYEVQWPQPDILDRLVKQLLGPDYAYVRTLPPEGI